MRITKQTIYCTLAVLFLLIAVVCGYLLLDSQHQKDEGRSAFRELASAVNEAQTTKQEAPDEPPAETENSLLAVYRALAEQNADMVGWIRIEGTTIDYPVMQTPDDFNFYLRRNFDKEYSNLGTPYIGIMFRLHLNIYTRNPTTRAALLGTSVTHSFFILPILQISHMPTSYPLISGVSTHILSPQKSDLFYFVTVVCFSFQLVKHLPKKR